MELGYPFMEPQQMEVAMALIESKEIFLLFRLPFSVKMLHCLLASGV